MDMMRAEQKHVTEDTRHQDDCINSLCHYINVSKLRDSTVRQSEESHTGGEGIVLYYRP
jgi:hypothetical protein